VALNPTAVQVARLSLWLTTLAADKPLTFLDHHLVTGNSLVGGAPEDLWRQPGGGGRRAAPRASQELFESGDFTPVLREAVRTRATIASQHDDSAAIVRAKEKTLAALQAPDAPLGRYRRALDLWCAGWFWPDGHPPDRAVFGDLLDIVLVRGGALPERAAKAILAKAQEAVSSERFLHWTLAFPEVFCSDDGQPLGNAGFDAVVGNPPWDMVRGDSGAPDTRHRRREHARSLAAFVRQSGIYRINALSHVNRCQLFVERMLQLVRRGGRIGLVLPAGTFNDTGSAPLRRHLFDHAALDSLDGFDNRRGIFPIHRSVRFMVMTGTVGQPTNIVRCRFGIDDVEALNRTGAREDAFAMSRAFVSRLSGDDDLAIPDLRSAADVAILERISARMPMLASSDGWNVTFGRELNASDDRELFVPFQRDASRTRPVLEGKQIEPFRVSVESCRYQLREDAVVRIARRPRLAYRDVASSTNRLTLIAAIVPAEAVTTHTLFCLKSALSMPAQHVLCALLNSFVANYLIRFRVNTHVTASLMARLRVPRVPRDTPLYDRLSALARTLMHSPNGAENQPEYAELQALVARLYGLSAAELRHVLSTLPLIPEGVKADTIRLFESFNELF
jgi:hypothetical protein